MPLSLRFSALSDVGRIRHNNEDSGYAGEHLLVVADGMGGAPAGDLASAVTVQTMRRLDRDIQGDLLEALAGAVQRANDRLGEMIEDDPSTDGMGTTLTAVLFDGERSGLAHIGDSRGYLLRDGTMQRITHDHTFVQSLIDEGRITEEEASSHPHRSLMLKVLDGRHDIDADISSLELRAGDRILLCSDGLDNARIEEDEIAQILADGSPSIVAAELVKVALRNGGPDNITCIVAEVVETGEETPDPDGTLLVGAAAEQANSSLGLTDGSGRSRDTGELPAVADEDIDPEELRYAPRQPRRLRWLRRLVAVAVVLGLIVLGTRYAYNWSQRQYYVGVADNKVVIFQGVQADIPGLDLSHVYESEDTTVDSLPQYLADRVSGGIEANDLDNARRIVAQLRQSALDCASPTPSPGPTKTPATTSGPPVPTRSTPASGPTTAGTPRHPGSSASQPSSPATGGDCAGASSGTTTGTTGTTGTTTKTTPP
jgi:protein phosphatase